MSKHLARKHTLQKHRIRSNTKKNQLTNKKSNKTNNKKSKKHTKTFNNKLINNSIGGGIMNLVIREEHNKSTTLPFGLSKLDPSKYLKSTRVNPNMFRVLYNYGTPYQIDLTSKQNQVLPSSQVINKPHIFPPDMNHYLILLIERPRTPPKSRLLWLASYRNRSWVHDILSYLPPSPKQGKTRTYALLVYKYPNEIAVANIYKPIETTTAKRKDEFRNFQNYLAANKMIQFIPGLTKYFKVQYDAGNALSFLSNVLSGKKQAGSVSKIRT